MSGSKRQAAFQGGKDGFQPNWDQDASQQEGEKPQRASAAQLAQRKIASLKRKPARPASSSSGVPMPAANPFANTPAFSFGSSGDFGATNGTSAAPAFGGFGASSTSLDSTSAAPLFSFGAASATTQSQPADSSAAPLFAFGNAFGGAPNNAAPTTNGTSAAPLFSFGSTTSGTPSPTPSFNFGGAPAQNEAGGDASSKPLFAFGAASSNNQTSDKPAGAPLFSFGAASTPAAGAASAEPPKPQSPSFTFGAASSGDKPLSSVKASNAASRLSRSRSSSPAKAAPPEKKSLFGNQLFSATSPSAAPSNAPAGGFNFFAQPAASQDKPEFVNFFGAGKTSQPAAAESATVTSDSSSTPASIPSLFGGLASSTPQSNPFGSSISGSSLFKKPEDSADVAPKPPADAAPSTTQTATAKAAASLFGFPPASKPSDAPKGDEPKADSTPAPAATFGTSANLFSFKPAATTTDSPSKPAVPETPKKSDASDAAPSLFGNLNKSTGPPSTPPSGNLFQFSQSAKPSTIGAKDFTASPADKAAPKFATQPPTAAAAAASPAKPVSLFGSASTPTVASPAKETAPKEPPKAITPSTVPKETAPKAAAPKTARQPEANGRLTQPSNGKCNIAVPPPPQNFSPEKKAQFVQLYRMRALNDSVRTHLGRQNDMRDWRPFMQYYIDCMTAIVNDTPEPGVFQWSDYDYFLKEGLSSFGKLKNAHGAVRPPSPGAKRKVDQLDEGDLTAPDSTKKSKGEGDISYPKLNASSNGLSTSAETNQGSTASSQTANLFGDLLSKSTPSKATPSLFSTTPSKAPPSHFSTTPSSNNFFSGTSAPANTTATPTSSTNLFAPTPKINAASATNLFAPTPKSASNLFSSNPSGTANHFGTHLSASGLGTPAFAFSAAGSDPSTPFGGLSRAGTVSPAPSTTGGASVFDSEEHRRTPDNANNFFLFAAAAAKGKKGSEEEDDDDDDEADDDEDAEAEIDDEGAETEGGVASGAESDAARKVRESIMLKAETSGRKDGLFGRVSFGKPSDGGSMGALSATPSPGASAVTSAAETSAEEEGAS